MRDRTGCRDNALMALLPWSRIDGANFGGVLVATDEGRPVYERLGFIPLIRLAMWLRP